MALCERAAVERDPKRLLELVSEINRLFDAREKRLAVNNDGKSPENNQPSDSGASSPRHWCSANCSLRLS